MIPPQFSHLVLEPLHFIFSESIGITSHWGKGAILETQRRKVSTSNNYTSMEKFSEMERI